MDSVSGLEVGVRRTHDLVFINRLVKPNWIIYLVNLEDR